MCCSEIGYGLQRGLGVGCVSAAPLEIGVTWGWGCDRLGVGLEVLGKVEWCYQMRWVFVKVLSGGGAMASPLEIGEGAPLELEGSWAGVGREFACWGLASSCEKVLGVVVWRLVDYR